MTPSSQGMKFVGIGALLCAALFWGGAFAAQSMGADYIGPFGFIAGKCIVASAFLGALIAGRYFAQKIKFKVDKNATPSLPKRDFRLLIVGGIICGLALFVADNFQQAGITAYPLEAAASGRSGFITATYVVMVAIFAFFMGKKIHPLVVVSIVVCLLGMYMLCVRGGLSGIYVGDVLVLAGALFYALHIVAVGRFSLLDALWLSLIQFITNAFASLICAIVFEHITLESFLPALLPIVYVGIFSTGLGYTLQTVGQKYVDAAPAAIIMSLESVFAALSGWIVLGELLSSIELVGCVLVFIAVIMAQCPEFMKPRPRIRKQ